MNTNYLFRQKTHAFFLTNSNLSYLLQTASYFALLFLIVILSAYQPVSAEPTTTPIIVVSNNQQQDTDHQTDITSAVNSAPPGARIHITKGTYIVDNPIILNTADVKLVGEGADKTILLAKNANQPVFLFDASGVSIESVTINALVDDGPGRASFAILVQEGKGDCKIAQTKIINTAASAIIGRSASGCTLVGNTILNSGDDGVRLAGDQLTVVDNTIIGYFDEALDLARGSNIVVTGNYVANGRIGIVVDDCSNTLVSQNYVENQILEGIVTGPDPDAIVTANIVRNSGSIGYNLHTPKIVAYNQAVGENKVGFRLTDMTDGIFFRNTTRGSNNGFEFRNETMPVNNNAQVDGEEKTIAGVSKDITFYKNCEQVLLDNSTPTCTPHIQGEHPTRKAADKSIASDTSIYKFFPSVEIQGATPPDEKRANKVAELMKYYNPGILSIHINNAKMKSEITADLYETIKETGGLGIGLVRAPFLQFSRGGERSFLWHLSVNGKDVVVVSSIYNGPKARISLLDNNEELSFTDSATLIKDKVLFKLFK